MNSSSDPLPLDFVSQQDPAGMRPFVEEVAGGLQLRFDMATVQSAMRLADPNALELEYTRTMMRCLLFNAAPKSVLILGFGGGSLAKYCHKHLPNANITAVEINPHVVALRDRFLVPPDSAHFKVILGDGAVFVQSQVATKARYDTILLDAFHFDGMSAAISNTAFFQACRSLLPPRGVLVVNLDGEPAQCQPVLARLSKVFGGGVWSVLTDGSNNRIAFCATATHLMDTMRQADARLAALAPVHRETLTRRDSNRLNFEPLFA